jgi:alkylated DNA repair dioxygenase AlkB
MAYLEGFVDHRLFGQHVLYVGRLPHELEHAASARFDDLWSLHPSASNEILIHGRMVPIPRWQQAYGRDYHFSGSVNRALPAPDILLPFLSWITSSVDERLNGLLLNWYDADRGHYIGAHRDNRKGLAPGTPIVTISAGATRTFRLRRPKEPGCVDFEATHGTVFVMPWETNLALKHEVPLQKTARGRRISITARAFS